MAKKIESTAHDEERKIDEQIYVSSTDHIETTEDNEWFPKLGMKPCTRGIKIRKKLLKKQQERKRNQKKRSRPLHQPK